jgi:2,3-bisphosphoglycerate-independent phosphoglycerate mutase
MAQVHNPTLLPRLARQTPSKILFVVLDGLGGAVGAEPTALERAHHPHLDGLARRSALGRYVPVADGVTPGSGPGHLSIFGHDPCEVEVGRGLLETLGVGVEVHAGDVCARGNFCTLDAQGLLADRRAARIPTEQSRPLVEALRAKVQRIEDVNVEVYPGLQHRFSMVFRAPGLGDRVSDTDPQTTGVAPLPAQAADPASGKTARVANRFVALAREIRGGRERANAVMLRGFSGRPPLATLRSMAALTACAVAAYPAYRGVARLLGMDLVEGVEPTSTIAQEVDALERAWRSSAQPYDFFFLHVKGTDSAGEDGDEAKKAQVLETFDLEVPRILALEPDVIVITGDHSTPGPMAGHSWHPVPFLLFGPWCEPDGLPRFDEACCRRGALGNSVPGTSLLRFALANAGKLAKFGA